MIITVETLGCDTAYDAPSTPIMGARRLYRVFVVIAARLLWQGMFIITEHNTVTWIGVWAVALDEAQGVLCFRRKFGDGDR